MLSHSRIGFLFIKLSPKKHKNNPASEYCLWSKILSVFYALILKREREWKWIREQPRAWADPKRFLWWQLRGIDASPKLYISFGRRGQMTAANAWPQGFLLSLDTDKLRETPALQKENIPSFHDIIQPGMEEEGWHSWWQPWYHLLLTNSSDCFTYTPTTQKTAEWMGSTLLQRPAKAETPDWQLLL